MLNDFRYKNIGTFEYAKDRDILKFKKYRQKRLENTGIYTHLVAFKTVEYTIRRLRTWDEEEKLIEAGFEFVW